MWKREINLRVIDKGPRYVEVELVNDNGVDVWSCHFVYGEQDSNKRVDFFWKIITKIQSIQNLLICIGDWNCLWFKEEKKGGDRISPRNLERARTILDDGNLIDLGHLGPQFTWINRRRGNGFIKERHDRGTANAEWNFMFPNAHIKNYISSGSDHSPLILDTCLVKMFGPHPFKFEWMWTSHPGCSGQVSKGWLKHNKGTNFDNVRNNLNRLPPILKKWNRKVFGFLREKIEYSKDKLKILYSDQDNENSMSRFRDEEGILSKLLHREEIL